MASGNQNRAYSVGRNRGTTAQFEAVGAIGGQVSPDGTTYSLDYGETWSDFAPVAQQQAAPAAAPAAPAPAPARSVLSSPLPEPVAPVRATKESVSREAEGLESTIKTQPVRAVQTTGREKRKRSYLTRA